MAKTSDKSMAVMFLAACLFITTTSGSSQEYSGTWKLLKKSIGISAMHIQLLPNDRVIAFDRTNFGPSNITLPESKCSKGVTAGVSESDCFAHSVEFNPKTRNVRPLTIVTDTWCSSGSLLPDGTLVQNGGYQNGERVVRYFKPCIDCDWVEESNGLLSPRWYSSSQILPDGKIIVVGGRYQFSYEFIPKISDSDQTLHRLPFLKETRYAPEIPNNLYPFLHLSPDGNLFIFANDRAILLDYTKNRVVRNYPVIPGRISRNYPSTGSSVLLPLNLSDQNNSNPDTEILICGGTEPDSNQKAIAGVFIPATKSCGRMIINAAMPTWEMEEMPIPRVMGDMILLPTGDLLIINGAEKGSAGWEVARDPVLNPVIYYSRRNTDRFEILSAAGIPRLYHSTAHLLSDGRVIVGGSNPNRSYNFTALFPTELSLEAFYPPYFNSTKTRPLIAGIKPGKELSYRQKFSVVFERDGREGLENVYVTMVAPSFTTHSFSMNQRVLELAVEGVNEMEDSGGTFVVVGFAPATAALAPPGYYQLFVVDGDVPSKAIWVSVK